MPPERRTVLKMPLNGKKEPVPAGLNGRIGAKRAMDAALRRTRTGSVETAPFGAIKEPWQ
jgi:hypothetical protein